MNYKATTWKDYLGPQVTRSEDAFLDKDHLLGLETFFFFHVKLFTSALE